MCVFQAQHHPPTTVQPLCHRMQLGPPLRVRRRLHLRPPPRCFQVRHVASAWTGSPEAISASSLFLILQSILFSELESLWDIISVIWFSTFPSRHRLKTFFFFYSARWNSIKRRDLQTSEPNTFSISPEKDSVTFQNSLTFNHMSASN